MAIVQLKDVRVERVHGRGNGVTVVEQSGKYKTYWAVFFEEPSGLIVGDTVSLSGFLSVKVSDKTREDGTPFLDYALNKPRVQGDADAKATSAVDRPASANDIWPTAQYAEDPPF